VKYTRTTISIPEHLLTLGQNRAGQFRLSFSEYLTRLIEEEARLKRTTLTLVAETGDNPLITHGAPLKKSDLSYSKSEAAKRRRGRARSSSKK
jgi:hypothetical protein